MAKRFKIRGGRFLVTGGTGSIGKAIVQRLLAGGAEVVRVFSRDESKQFEMEHELGQTARLKKTKGGTQQVAYGRTRFLIGDVRDKERLSRALDGIDYVFHTAAMKHVPACEYNPFEAVLSNVIGVQNLVEASLAREVECVVCASTDKATHPDNTMGATKLLGEKLVAAGNYLKGEGRTRFCSVRFGNVLGSRGSALPLFARQIAAGGPVTVTDPDMTRYVMTLDSALDLLFESMKLCQGGEVFCRRMPVVKLEHVVDIMIERLAPRAGYKPSQIEQEIVGLRPSETRYEDLITEAEGERAFEVGGLIVVAPSVQYRKQRGAVPFAGKRYTSRDEEPMSRAETERLLKSIGVI